MGIITELDRIIAAIARAHQAVEEMGGNTSVPYLVENLEAAVKSIPKGEDLTAVLNEQERKLTALLDSLEGKVAGGGGGQLGGLSQYAKIIAKPASTSQLYIENPLGGIARKVCVQRTITDITETRKIQTYIIDTDLGIGVVKLVATDGGAMYGTKPYDSGTGNGKFTVQDGSVTLYRYNGSNMWDSESEYEVEIWQ